MQCGMYGMLPTLGCTLASILYTQWRYINHGFPYFDLMLMSCTYPYEVGDMWHGYIAHMEGLVTFLGGGPSWRSIEHLGGGD